MSIDGNPRSIEEFNIYNPNKFSIFGFNRLCI